MDINFNHQDLFRSYTGERIRLRALRDTDLEAVLEYRNDPVTTQFTPYTNENRSKLQLFLSEQKSLWEGDKARFSLSDLPKSVMYYGIEDSGSGQLAGECLIIFSGHLQAEIGYVIAPGYRGKGFAKEAVSTLLNICFSTLKLHRLSARVHPENIASINVLKSFSFRKEGRFLEDYFKDGVWFDTDYFALLAREWKIIRDGPNPYAGSC